jgi:ribosomal protein L12E/L44/L45/RPP1/RPP2
MAFDKIILGVITRTVKSTARFDIAVNSIKTQFNNGCPAPQELTKIIQSKNQINQALTQALGALSTIEKTAGTINGILTGIDGAIKVIKAIPIPTSVPPGPGIPINILTKLSDSLITLRDFVKTNKGIVNQIPSAISSIQAAIQKTINLLNSLDALILKCLNEQTSNLTPEAKEAYFNQIGFALTQTGNNSNSNINISANSILEAQLQPNAVNPLIYKDFKLTLEYDSSNRFSFPSRRIKGVNDKTGQIVYNYGGKYSYSSSTEVLFDEIKYQIDRLVPNVNVVDEVNDIIEKVKDTVNAAQAEAERLAEEARQAAADAARQAEEDERQAEEAAIRERLRPFGIVGYSNEIKKFDDGSFDGTYYQFKSDIQQWVVIDNMQLLPFGEPGIRDGEERSFSFVTQVNYTNPSVPGVDFFELVTVNEKYIWSNDDLKWVSQGQTYG